MLVHTSSLKESGVQKNLLKQCKNLLKHCCTGVRIIGPVGIGEVQMTTFFYGTKSLLKMSFRILLIFVGWGFNRR